MSFNNKAIRGVLLDITGVLVESSASGDGVAIQGSIRAIERMKEAGKENITIISANIIEFKYWIFLLSNLGIQVRFVTNETQKTRKALVEKLHRLGYSMEEELV